MAYKLAVVNNKIPLVFDFATKDAALAARNFFRKEGARAEVIFDVGTDVDVELDFERMNAGYILAGR